MTAQKTLESPEPTLYDVIDVMKIGFERVENRLDALDASMTAFREENRLEHQEMNRRLLKLAIQNEDKTSRIESHEGRITSIERWKKGMAGA